MKRLRSYCFLFLPDDHSRSREFRVPRVVFFSLLSFLIAAIVMSGLYLSGLVTAAAQRRDSQHILAENRALQAEVTRLEQKLGMIQRDLGEVFRLQESLAKAAGVDPLGATVWEAGVGGRSALSHLSGYPLAGAEGERLAALDEGLDKLLRQARLQNESFQAMIDTLAGRAAARDRLPSIRPIAAGWVNSGFGKRADPFTGRLVFHAGVDFSAPIGTPIVATADGTVTGAGFEAGFGHLLEIRHGERLMTRYAHLSKILVQRGQSVRRGQVVALSGKSGRATAPHLHYEVHLNGRPVNPLAFILEDYAWR